MIEVMAFILLCVIAIWSYVRGYRLWKSGRFLSAILFATVGAYVMTFIIAKLGEWI